MEKHLHIICLNVPYPVDYGGVFDLFYKLVALKNLGIKIHLHCFEYGRGQQPVLNEYCETVNYYKRLEGWKSFSLTTPYIVASRKSEELAENLLKDNYPILMEGVHCTFLLHDERFKSRRCFVRLHNVEHIYYRHLYQSSPLSFKKLYYGWESVLLKKYEQHIAKKATFLTVIKTDIDVYSSFGAKQVFYLPLFLPPWQVNGNTGKGTYCLYHGDLSVPENERAAKWLLENVFCDLEIPFVIAGKNPSATFHELAESSTNTCLIANPQNDEMQDLIAKAQLHILPSFNATGIKLKLINVLFNGRHCITNNATVQGSDMESCCSIASTPTEFKQQILELFHKEFTEEDLLQRKRVLEKLFDQKANAQQLVELVSDAV